MAHQLTHEQLDELAAQERAALQTEPAATPEPPLAAGALGEAITRLVNLLAFLGYSSNDVIKGAPPVLNDSVLADVHQAQAALQVAEPDAATVTDVTWAALYAAAEVKVEAERPTA